MSTPPKPTRSHVCPKCRTGAMLLEHYAEAAQDPAGTRVAVVKNVPRHRCTTCGHRHADLEVTALVNSHLADALRRNQVTVFDWQKVTATLRSSRGAGQ